MIDLAILGLLNEGDLHGYELRKRVADVLGSHRGALSFGSLYPALARLERGRLVRAATDAKAGGDRPGSVPSSGSLAGELAAFRARHPLPKPGGRGRKVYGITEQGQGHLLELLREPETGDDRTFALRVAFCRFLGPEQRLELFRRRRDEMAARLSDRSGPPRGHDSRIDRYLRSLREHDTQSITHELAWLDRLIAEEEAVTTEEAAS